MDSLIDNDSIGKVQLGMGELFAILQTGVNVAPDTDTWSFLEVAQDTVITSLTFKYDKSDIDEVVTRYNVTFTYPTLIPPVFKGQAGKWVSATCEGQINCYGENPIG